MRGSRRRDAGSERIRALLDQDSERLTQNFVSLLAALRVSPDQEYGVPPQSGFDAIADTRAAFEEVSQQISAIATANPAKGDVLAALRAVSGGYDQLARGLETGVSRRALKRLKSARKMLRRANEDLASARSRL